MKKILLFLLYLNLSWPTSTSGEVLETCTCTHERYSGADINLRYAGHLLQESTKLYLYSE